MKKTGLYDGAGSEVEWITTENGEHVPIEEGQTKAEAIKEHFDKPKQSDADAKKQDTSEEELKDQPAFGSQEELDRLYGEEFKGYKGQAAIDKLMQEKRGHIKGAFHRDDTGDIDLLWGSDYVGLQHIIKQREEQGIDSKDFVKDLADVVEQGVSNKKTNRGDLEFWNNGKMAVVAIEYHGNKITYLLTAFKRRKK